MRTLTSLPLLLALATCTARAALAQEPVPPPATGEPDGLAGAFAGWARLTNEWPGLPCRYDSAADAEAVQLELRSDGGALRGSLAIDVPAAAGSPCPALRKRYAIAEVTEGPGTLAFTDSGGNEWTLSVRRQGQVLQGLLAWRAGGPEQPLAEGFTSAGGERPPSRLSGEVRLHRVVEREPARTASTAGGAAPKKTSGGTVAKDVGIVLGANVVGLGALYAANVLGKRSGDSGGTVSCSPRVCTVHAPGQGCTCTPSQDTGALCPPGTPGVDVGGVCDGRSLPCMAGLSCDQLPGATGHVCRDRFSAPVCP